MQFYVLVAFDGLLLGSVGSAFGSVGSPGAIDEVVKADAPIEAMKVLSAYMFKGRRRGKPAFELPRHLVGV